MRVIQVIPDFSLGGIQKAGCVLAEAMLRAGHQVLLLGDNPGPRFQPSCSWHRLLPGARLQALVGAAREFGPDVIHLHAPEYPEDLIRGLAAELREKPPLLVTTPVFGRPPEDRGALALTRTCCVGVFTFYRLGRWLRQSPAQMVHNGISYVPLTPFQPPPVGVDRAAERRALAIPQDAFVFGRVGRSQGGKWHPCYPEVIDAMLRVEPGAQWISVGFPEELGREDLRQRWGDRFHDFPETADYQFLAAILSAMDVQLFWSQHGECFAATICEAAGMGTPTISGVNPCQDNGQVEQVMEGVTGELVGTPAQAIASLRRLALDRSLLRALRSSAREHAWRRWHVDRVSADLCELYEYWRFGKASPYLGIMLREHDALMKNYRRQIATLKGQGSFRHSAWEMALWSAESWPLFAGARLVKPYIRRLLASL
ncbi:MAG: glycosyltransferase family 4 protein [Terriglobales bacterium]